MSERRSHVVRTRYELECVNCGNHFEAQTRGAKWCTSSCGKDWRRNHGHQDPPRAKVIKSWMAPPSEDVQNIEEYFGRSGIEISAGGCAGLHVDPDGALVINGRTSSMIRGICDVTGRDPEKFASEVLAAHAKNAAMADLKAREELLREVVGS